MDCLKLVPDSSINHFRLEHLERDLALGVESVSWALVSVAPALGVPLLLEEQLVLDWERGSPLDSARIDLGSVEHLVLEL